MKHVCSSVVQCPQLTASRQLPPSTLMWFDAEARQPRDRRAAQAAYAKELAQHADWGRADDPGRLGGRRASRPLDAARPSPLSLDGDRRPPLDALEQEAARQREAAVSKQRLYLEDLKQQMEAKKAAAERERREERERSERAEREAQSSSSFWGTAAAQAAPLRDAGGRVLGQRRFVPPCRGVCSRVCVTVGTLTGVPGAWSRLSLRPRSVRLPEAASLLPALPPLPHPRPPTLCGTRGFTSTNCPPSVKTYGPMLVVAVCSFLAFLSVAVCACRVSRL